MVAIDSIAYRRFQVVPLNIVTYNVFSGPGRGPNIFGTEPWWYYVFNLLLLFNVGAVTAFASLALIVKPPEMCF
jgi:alpha-1,2-mannosyltransferase